MRFTLVYLLSLVVGITMMNCLMKKYSQRLHLRMVTALREKIGVELGSEFWGSFEIYKLLSFLKGLQRCNPPKYLRCEDGGVSMRIITLEKQLYLLSS